MWTDLNGFGLKSFSVSCCNFEGGMPSSEPFRVDFQSNLEQAASSSRRDAGRPECFAPRSLLVEKAFFSHVRIGSREEVELLNIC
jgi:hypothetical protein